MNGKVYYIGFYDSEDNKKENRKYILAATNKMRYIANTIAATGRSVTIVSISETMNRKCYRGKKVKLSDKLDYVLFSTPPYIGKLSRIIQKQCIGFSLLCYVVRNAHKDDTVIVYHSMRFIILLMFLKKLIGFKLICEIEELYGDVSGSRSCKRKELRWANQADAFILPTMYLNTAVNRMQKPIVVIHGTYEVERCLTDKFEDEKVHVIYAGTFDLRKGGAATAVGAAEYLNERYHMHILGFGSEDDTKQLLKAIMSISKTTKCIITYDGCLSGENYIRFLQKCDIGLSTQNPNAAFNATSFPSKVLSYMANGLRVVSIRIPAVETSAVGNMLNYYDHQVPQEIANAIMGVNLDDGYDGRKLVSRLSKQFHDEIDSLITNLN